MIHVILQKHPFHLVLLCPRSVQKVVLCSGKHYYALLKQRDASAANQNTALVRVEELCPFPLEPLQQELRKYPNATGLQALDQLRVCSCWKHVDLRVKKVKRKFSNTLSCPQLKDGLQLEK